MPCAQPRSAGSLAARISAPRRAMVRLEPMPMRWATAGSRISEARAKPAPSSRAAISGLFGSVWAAGCDWFMAIPLKSVGAILTERLRQGDAT